MKLFQNMVLAYSRRRYGSDNISFSSCLKKPFRVLVIMPVNRDHALLCDGIITLLRNHFGFEEMLFTGPSRPMGKLYELTKGYKFLFPDISELPKYGLPNKQYLKRVIDFKPKLALDLEMTEDPHNSIIVLKSGANARIGGERGIGAPFYNIEVRNSPIADIKRKYGDMEEFLANFLIPVSPDGNKFPLKI